MKHLLLISAFVVLSSFTCNKKTVASECKETINPDCICTMEYNPVCGCNNKTYSNACHAACSGISKHSPGECQ